jgi:hypothetical protein
MGRKLIAFGRVADMIRGVIEPYGCQLKDKDIVYKEVKVSLDTAIICFHVEHQQFGSIVQYVEEISKYARNTYYMSAYNNYVKLHREKEWINFLLPRRPGHPKWNIY